MIDPHAGTPTIAAGAPLGESRAAVIMIHGRGAAPANILTLVPALERPGFSFLAPAAAGNTWYPLSFLAAIERNEPYLSSALRRVHTLVEEVVAHGIPRQRLVLLGFSQGACLAGEFACRHPRRYGGLVMFSGGLIGPPGTAWNHPGSFEGTPAFLGCSDRDAHVPKGRVDESAAALRDLGADVTERIYPGLGHVVNDNELAFARTLLDAV